MILFSFSMLTFIECVINELIIRRICLKIIIFKRKKSFIAICFGICFFMVFLMNLVGYVFDWKYISVLATIEEVNDFEVQNKLLKDTFEEVGVSTPEAAAMVWSDGLKERSAALQYAVMSKELRDEYEEQLKLSAPNWVTGISSPWVESVKIIRMDEVEKDCYIIKLLFTTATSVGPFAEYRAVLTINREGEFWRITKIKQDQELYVYTRFSS